MKGGWGRRCICFGNETIVWNNIWGLLEVPVSIWLYKHSVGNPSGVIDRWMIKRRSCFENFIHGSSALLCLATLLKDTPTRFARQLCHGLRPRSPEAFYGRCSLQEFAIFGLLYGLRFTLTYLFFHHILIKRQIEQTKSQVVICFVRKREELEKKVK